MLPFFSAYSHFDYSSCLDGWQNPLVIKYLHFIVTAVDRGVSVLPTYDVMLRPLELKEVK